jgi:hypothetical protein
MLSGATKLSAAVIDVSLIMTPMGFVVSDVGGGVVLVTLVVLSASEELSPPFPQAVKTPAIVRAKNVFFMLC